MNELMQEGCGLWWLSFVNVNYETDEREFVGVMIVPATDQYDAMTASWALGAAPDAETLPVGPFPPHAFENKWLNRLLTRDEAAQIPEPSGDWASYFEAGQQKETS